MPHSPSDSDCPKKAKKCQEIFKKSEIPPFSLNRLTAI